MEQLKQLQRAQLAEKKELENFEGKLMDKKKVIEKENKNEQKHKDDAIWE